VFDSTGYGSSPGPRRRIERTADESVETAPLPGMIAQEILFPPRSAFAWELAR